MSAPGRPPRSRHTPSCTHAGPGTRVSVPERARAARQRTASARRRARCRRAAAPETFRRRTAERRACERKAHQRLLRTHLIAGVLVRVQAKAHGVVRLLDLALRSRLRQTKRVIQGARHPARSARSRPHASQSVGSATTCPAPSGGARGRRIGPWNSRARKRGAGAACGRDCPATFAPPSGLADGGERLLCGHDAVCSSAAAVHCGCCSGAPAPRCLAPRWVALRAKGAMCAARAGFLRRRQSSSAALEQWRWRSAGAVTAPPRDCC